MVYYYYQLTSLHKNGYTAIYVDDGKRKSADETYDILGVL